MRLILGECNPEISRPLQDYLTRHGYTLLSQVASPEQLLEKLTQYPIDLLLLGELSGANCFAVFRDCRKRWPKLPVILISHQPVSDVFRDWVIQRGINDIFYSHSDDFTSLNRAIVRSIHDGAIEPKFQDPVPSGGEILNLESIKRALEEINDFSTQYFGPLAIGHYWRKSYQKALSQHQSLEIWSVDYQGNFNVDLNPDAPNLTPEEVEGIKAWIHFFLQECQRIIIDFPAILRKAPPSPVLGQLLSYS